MLGRSTIEQFYLEPILVISDRYGGAYSGGDWVAFGRGDVDIVKASLERVWDGDVECRFFWTDEMKAVTGQGETPCEAVSKLKRRSFNMTEQEWVKRYYKALRKAKETA